MQCPNCDREIPLIDIQFCPYCGSPLNLIDTPKKKKRDTLSILEEKRTIISWLLSIGDESAATLSWYSRQITTVALLIRNAILVFGIGALLVALFFVLNRGN
jgi:hypothetical protein